MPQGNFATPAPLVQLCAKAGLRIVSIILDSILISYHKSLLHSKTAEQHCQTCRKHLWPSTRLPQLPESNLLREGTLGLWHILGETDPLIRAKAVLPCLVARIPVADLQASFCPSRVDKSLEYLPFTASRPFTRLMASLNMRFCSERLFHECHCTQKYSEIGKHISAQSYYFSSTSRQSEHSLSRKSFVSTQACSGRPISFLALSCYC